MGDETYSLSTTELSSFLSTTTASLSLSVLCKEVIRKTEGEGREIVITFSFTNMELLPCS